MIEWQTETPVRYEDLTPEMKKDICNGCGGKGGIVKPPHRAFFKASCNHHDYGYACGGSKLERQQADRILYKYMVEDCASLPWAKWIRYRPWCELYYRAVRIMGWKFFHFGDRRWPVI